MRHDTLEPGTYFGRTTPHLDAAGLVVAETEFAADLVIPAHEHVNPFFCFVLQGHGMRAWPARAGAEAPMVLTLFPAGVPHANCWHGSGGRALHVEFERAWLERRSEHLRLLADPRDFAGGPPIWFAHRLAAECRRHDDVTPLAVEGLVLELLAACARAGVRPSARVPRWLDRVRDLLHARFAEALTMAEIAAAACVSSDHLAREFRRHHACTIAEYLRRLRVQFACRELVNGEHALSEIADAAGFADQSHFTRVFRQQFGMTPAAYRRLHGAHRVRSRV